MSNPVSGILSAHKAGQAVGICSVCTANSLVIQAVMELATSHTMPVLIESTSNQVNQNGGYTGVVPSEFAKKVKVVAEGFVSPARLCIGGDHLGPYPWRNLPQEQAMARAITLVETCVSAGYSKIHLDASMPLFKDAQSRSGGLPVEMAAERAAILCEAAERAAALRYGESNEESLPVYVIGTEVPTPGGAPSPLDLETHEVTRLADLEAMLGITEAAFQRHGLARAWTRVVAVVVQLGVEFGDDGVAEYDWQRTAHLRKAISHHPNLVFEGHSTDYQTPTCLRTMVEDGVAVLKVGPELTYALREAVFLLEDIEAELSTMAHYPRLSLFSQALESSMTEDDSHWRDYYHGAAQKLRFSRRYSLLDRSRYYWDTPQVQAAFACLVGNLGSRPIPLSLVSQYFPAQYRKIRAGALVGDPLGLAKDRVKEVLAKYHYATTGVWLDLYRQ